MTNQQHPITPPPELVHQLRFSPCTWLDQITNAYQAGADQELEACEKWVASHFDGMMVWSATLRAARRPKPPSLKEQALARTDAILNDPNRALLTEVRETLELNRRALEALPE